ncbi:MAG: peptide chain release factor 1 [Actinobacteria bacterium]|nr:peptide chain release factor 1 [Actinomycetota bacterium]MCL5446064.1 peptide chain release factor 1 [Actinomycetota bacterium]
MDPLREGQYEAEREAIAAQLSDQAVISDPAKLRELSKRFKELESITRVVRNLRQAEGDLHAARELYNDLSGDDRDLARTEVEEAERALEKCEQELRDVLVPRDPNAGRDVMLEIRGAEGGEEANLFARDLFEMYRKYAEQKGWKSEVLSLNQSEQDGINEAVVVFKGEDAWQRLKHEGGPHRVQRVPATESQGRVHTSSATVTVIPVAEEVEVEIEPSEIRVDVFRSTGPGGQSVNTTDSAVRITHIPTGIVVSMQEERSQIQNRARAMQVLRSRLLQLEQERKAGEESALRKSQVGGGGRSEKVRTYNFRENRVTDHRTKLTLYKLDRVLQGDLDEIVDGLLADERSRQLLDSSMAGDSLTMPAK